MHRRFGHSLLLRVGFALALIAGFALVGMVSSVIIAETLRGEASAINRAGALRMQMYLISTELLQPVPAGEVSDPLRFERYLGEFENRLRSGVLTRILPADPTDPARAAYDDIGRKWDAEIRPALLLVAGTGASTAQWPQIRREIDAFVAGIDQLVGLLERKTEAKVQVLRLTQGVFLFLTLAVVFITLYMLRTEVLRPLRDLLQAAEAVRRRDFSWRVEHTGDDELGQLGTSFNAMAQDLSEIYRDLESRVREKTAVLERTNRSLELMYRSLRHLHDANASGDSYVQTLLELENFLGLSRGSICVVEEEDSRGYQVAATVQGTGDAAEAGAPRCSAESCSACVDRVSTRLSRPQIGTPSPGERLLTVPLRDGERLVGVLTMHVPDEVNLESWQIQLAEGVAQHLGVAMGKQRRNEQYHRLALLEERATIARELHDSLAQGLTYLKIQFSRLQGMLGQQPPDPRVEETVRDLREGLNDAYRELRELLTTFRIRMDENGLNRALQSSTREFAERGHIDIRLDNRVADGQLGANAEIHVLQIVREALANVLKHAQANSASVTLAPGSNGSIRVAVEDDGRGIREDSSRHGHYGLTIMRERARKLNAELHVERRTGGGTRVALDIDPQTFSPETRHQTARAIT